MADAPGGHHYELLDVGMTVMTYVDEVLEMREPVNEH